MPTISLTDTTSQIAELQRRQKLAEALAAQGAAPIEVQSYKGIQAPISPFSVLAKVLDTYTSKKDMADAIKREAEARKTAREESQTALKQYYGNPEFSKFENPISAQEAAVPALTPVAPPETIQMGGVPTNVKGNVTPVTSAQGPTTYNNAQYIEPQATQGRETTPQERMAMALQFQGSGNQMLEQMAPALYGEAKGEAKAKKVFDAIGDVSKEYGGDPRIMAGIVAAGDPNAGIDYLMKLGASAATAKQEMAKLIYTATEKAEENKKDRENKLEALGLTLADRQEGRNQASLDRQFIAGLTGGRAQTAGTVNLRKEFNALPEVKTYKQVNTSYQNLKSAAKLATPAGDQAMIFGVMKMLDPQSVVRESEQATIRNAGSIPDKVRNLYNYTVRGNKLNDAQRQDFLKMADGQFNNYKNQYTQSANAYRGYATDSGYDPDKIVSLGNSGPTQSAPAAGRPLTDAELLAKHR
jgi:hypothetical protein